MCGIVGTFRSNGLTPVEIEATRNLTELMRKRGPDDEGFWTDQRFCVLGFRRLAILDLSSAANQPMITADQRYILVFNGEVYNFVELRSRLQSKGVQFHSSGDSEVVLYALATWGTEALRQFNGMFALAFYDSLAKRLLLARDHAGMKPLYYMRSATGIAFASQYDQILAHPWAKTAAISSDSLALYLRFGYIPAPYALLQNTYLLEPGSWLQIYENGNTLHGKFFEFPKYLEPKLSIAETPEAVDDAITKAVKRHVVSDVPVGAFLSGGIDSPLIVAKMKNIIGTFPTFTIGIDDPERDESRAAATYAQEFGVDNLTQQMTSEATMSLLRDMTAACGEPFADYSILPTLMICQLAKRNHVKVLLSGDGGDELFWGYWQRFSAVLDGLDRYREPYWRRELRNRYRSWRHPERSNQVWPTVGDWYRKIHQRLPETWFQRIFSGLKYPPDFDLYKFSENRGDKDRAAQWLRWNEYQAHLSMVLMKVDRASMHHSLEVRIPLLDREVLDIAMKTPWQSCMNMETNAGKQPLRNALARSTQSQTHEKKGFTIPLDRWFRTSLKSLFEEIIFSRKEILGFAWNRKAIRAYFDSHLSGQENNEWGLWVLLNLALWEDKYS